MAHLFSAALARRLQLLKEPLRQSARAGGRARWSSATAPIKVCKLYVLSSARLRSDELLPPPGLCWASALPLTWLQPVSHPQAMNGAPQVSSPRGES